MPSKDKVRSYRSWGSRLAERCSPPVQGLNPNVSTQRTNHQAITPLTCCSPEVCYTERTGIIRRDYFTEKDEHIVNKDIDDDDKVNNI